MACTSVSKIGKTRLRVAMHPYRSARFSGEVWQAIPKTMTFAPPRDRRGFSSEVSWWPTNSCELKPAELNSCTWSQSTRRNRTSASLPEELPDSVDVKVVEPADSVVRGQASAGRIRQRTAAAHQADTNAYPSAPHCHSADSGRDAR